MIGVSDTVTVCLQQTGKKTVAVVVSEDDALGGAARRRPFRVWAVVLSPREMVRHLVQEKRITPPPRKPHTEAGGGLRALNSEHPPIFMQDCSVHENSVLNHLQ